MSAMTRRELAESLRGGRFTSVGSYPKFWLAKDGSVLSHAAIMADPKRYMRATGRPGHYEPDYCIIACNINWEDPALYCDDTGKRIESAYAEGESDNT